MKGVGGAPAGAAGALLDALVGRPRGDSGGGGGGGGRGRAVGGGAWYGDEGAARAGAEGRGAHAAGAAAAATLRLHLRHRAQEARDGGLGCHRGPYTGWESACGCAERVRSVRCQGGRRASVRSTPARPEPDRGRVVVVCVPALSGQKVFYLVAAPWWPAVPPVEFQKPVYVSGGRCVGQPKRLCVAALSSPGGKGPKHKPALRAPKKGDGHSRTRRALLFWFFARRLRPVAVGWRSEERGCPSIEKARLKRGEGVSLP
jgi:hypothetical protein